ncbi:hypothetical protein PIB30_039232 [Stylosanthes scabra]|uniref:Uncharacterized protein n=1 Tax=Stylosanthes scabra TaxID=79078 RepID=A0ABU6TDW4_9FABA|nr:hypothetical protein [Stylosanthes scabra]
MRVLAQLTLTLCGVRLCLTHARTETYGAGGFFASSLRRSGYEGSSASTTSSHTGPADAEVVDLREQVQNLTQSLHSQGEVLQQQINEMAAYYDPLRAMSSTTAVGGSGGSSTAPPPLPPRPPSPPPPAQPDHGLTDDDDDYVDA